MTFASRVHQSISANFKVDEFWNNVNYQPSVASNTKIISYAKKIPPTDLLAFIQKFAGSNNKYFYWENPRKQEAVAAYGTIRSLEVNSLKRFAIAQNFVRDCFKQIIRRGESKLTEGNPCVFCNFTFFSEISQEPFPVSTLFLPQVQIVKRNKVYCIIINLPVHEADRESIINKRIEQKINSINWSDLKIQVEDNCAAYQSNYSEIKNSERFKSVVNLALKSIAKSEFSKIVIANTTELKSSAPFDLIKSLNSLRETHPDCYTFSISNGLGQNFIGASPERLVSIQNQQLVTDALAGSISRGKTSTEDLYLANLLLKNRKEKREHQAVSDYITESLRQLNLKPQQLPLQILKLSNIQHLWTPIYAHLPLDIKPLEIVAQLHPTPAVAGVPTKIACEKIRQYEECDRSLYGAPLGWVDAENNCEFIVGIRSALIDGNRARLYAGAGIVSGSEPDKEFAEVQLKLQTSIKALVQS